MPTLHIVNNYSRKFSLRVSGGVLDLGMEKNDNMNETKMITQKERAYFMGALVTTDDGRKGIVESIKNNRLHIESENGARFDVPIDEIDDVLATAESLADAEWERVQNEDLNIE